MIFCGNQSIKASDSSGGQGSSMQDLKLEERDKKLSSAAQTMSFWGASGAASAASAAAASASEDSEDFVQDEDGVKNIAKGLWDLVKDKSQKSLSNEQMKLFGGHVTAIKKLSWKKYKKFTTEADHLFETLTNIATAYGCCTNDPEGLVVATKYGLWSKQDYFLK